MNQVDKSWKDLLDKEQKHIAIDNNDEDKKPKGTKKCVIKRKLKFKD